MKPRHAGRLEDILYQYPDGLTAGELAEKFAELHGQSVLPEHIADMASRSNLIYLAAYQGARPTPALQRQALALAQAWRAERRDDRPPTMEAVRAHYHRELAKLTHQRVAGNKRAFLYQIDRADYERRRQPKVKPVTPVVCPDCHAYHNETIPRVDCRVCGRPLPEVAK